jgi:hypothetical protein
MTPKETLIFDCRVLLQRLVDLAKADVLTPQTLVACVGRVDAHLAELQRGLDRDAELIQAMAALQARVDGIAALPPCEMRFRGRFAVIEGGRR